MSVESYAHKAAKNVVMEWLREADDRATGVYSHALDTAWFSDWDADNHWSEYPVLPDGTGLRVLWREATPEQGIPTYEALRKAGRPPAAIFDVAIADLVYIRTGIEIVHKHPPSARKLAFLKAAGLTELLVLPARWVLGQIAPPRTVPEEFWAWR